MNIAKAVGRLSVNWTWLMIGVHAIIGCQPRYYSSEGNTPDKYSGNMKLYAITRDYIQNDTAARRAFNHPDPFQVWVLEETTCNPIDWWDTGIIVWMGLRRNDPEEQDRLEDSLRRYAAVTPCDVGKNPALRQLSTTDDRLYTIVYMQIDSTFIPGSYIVSAYLSHNICRENNLNGALWQVTMAYALVLGKDGEIRVATNDNPSYPHAGKPCKGDS